MKTLHDALLNGEGEAAQEAFVAAHTALRGRNDDEGQWLLGALLKARSLFEQGELVAAAAVVEKMIARQDAEPVP